MWSRKQRRLYEKLEGMPEHPRSGEEAEVSLKFDVAELEKIDGIRKLSEISRLLSELGIGFDSGAGDGEIDWEWDWSLRGPVKVNFVRFTKDNPSNRHMWEKVKSKRLGKCLSELEE